MGKWWILSRDTPDPMNSFSDTSGGLEVSSDSSLQFLITGVFDEYEEGPDSTDISEPLNHSPLSSDDNDNVVVAVMGATGVGKSTYIRMVSGRDDVVVGNNLSSETSQVNAYDFSYKDKNYTLVDTPGFDEAGRSDSEITELILTWFKESMLEGHRLNGVIYLHRIIETRMRGTAVRNNRMFRKLCGDEAFKNVILATTFWENVSEKDGERREEELCQTSDFWGDMVTKGARIHRLYNNRQSGLELLEQISGNSKVTLNSQDEMVNQRKSVSDTDAGKQQKKLLERAEREMEGQRKAEKERLLREARIAEIEWAKRLRREREKLERIAEAARKRDKQEQARLLREVQERYEKQRREEEAGWKRQEEIRRRERRKMEHRKREEQRRREDRIAQERAEAEAERKRRLEFRRKQQEQKEEMNRKERKRLAEIEAKRQAEYVCKRVKPEWPCDNCGASVSKYLYYHCCFCEGDLYFHCSACGSNCGNPTHPSMKLY